ncbi:MAG: hypothetical protein OXG90_13105 [Gammaproteobacteria bacterium]|nr:hypothetical protein [Gammaproteobacteria bacterium]
MLRKDNLFRAWGLLGNVIQAADVGRWAFLGCVSMEYRSVVALLQSREAVEISDLLMFSIADSSESRFFTESMELTRAHRDLLLEKGVPRTAFREHELLEPFGDIQSAIDEFLDNCVGQNLMFDISSMPKKLFFFVVKRAMQRRCQFENIIAVYSEPERYSNESLAENPQQWSTLPGFDGPRRLPEPEKRRIVIAMGFEPLGLPDLVVQGEFADVKIHLLFPFPTPPDRIRKNWEFARDLFPEPTSSIQFRHVDGWNVPDVFDLLGTIGQAGQTQLTLAPYGPKPMSLAMALYAGSHDNGSNATAVYYTQPTAYNPRYSTGVRTIGGQAGIHCYAIKRLGQFLY